MEQNHDMDEIDLLELARLLWSHALQIAAAGIAAAVICLLACISVDGVGSTQIMSITVTNEDPALAGKIVQAIAETAPDVIVDKVEAGSCKVVSDVEITSNPVFPQTKKYVLIAALGGIVAACGILVLDHLLHDYIVDSEDIQKKLELPVLGLIPEV